MRALVIESPGHTRVAEIEKPVPGPEEVLLRTQLVGCAERTSARFAVRIRW